MSLTPPILTDGNLTLRPLREDDAARIVEQCRDPLSQTWTIAPADYSLEDALRFIRDIGPGGWASGRECLFAIEYDGRFGGSLSLRIEGDAIAEIAYGTHPDVRGLGVAERACRLLIAWGFDQLHLHTIKWYCVHGNWASRKLAWRLGFSFDGTLRGWLPHRGDQVDAWAGALLRDEPMEPRTEWFDVPTIEGSRVRLRRCDPKDSARLIEGANDPWVSDWIYKLPAPYTQADADRYFSTREEDMAMASAVHWVMAAPETDDFLGDMSVLRIARPLGEIGYWAHPEARGGGVVTEAAQLAIRHAFADLGLTRLTLYTSTENVGSMRVADKCGFTRIGTERRGTQRRSTGFTDCAIYDLLPEDLPH